MLQEKTELWPERRTCVECSGKLVLDPESGEQVCGVCGVVSTAWDLPLYQLSQPDIPKREEPSSNLMYDIGLHTLMGTADFNGRTTRASGGFEQLRRLNNFTITRDSKMSNGMRAMNEINQIVGALGLSNTVSREAQEIYHKGLVSGLIRGKSISNMSAAAVLVACRVVGVSCSSGDMERVLTTISGKTTRRYYRLLVRSMGLRFDHSDPSSYVARIASKSGLSIRVARRALEMLQASGNNQIFMDKRSSSMAAASLYLAARELGEGTSQLRLAVAGGITPITIRKRSAELSRVLESANETSPEGQPAAPAPASVS